MVTAPSLSNSFISPKIISIVALSGVRLAPHDQKNTPKPSHLIYGLREHVVQTLTNPWKFAGAYTGAPLHGRSGELCRSHRRHK